MTLEEDNPDKRDAVAELLALVSNLNVGSGKSLAKKEHTSRNEVQAILAFLLEVSRSNGCG